MKRGFEMRTAAGWAGLAAGGGLAVFSFPLIVRLGLAVAAAGCLWFWINRTGRARDAEWRDRMIRVLGHHRHDWMNELQVLYGYARLKRFDNLPEYMDKIRTTSLHDSYLSKLGIPELVVYLLEKRIAGGDCVVEVELEQEIDLTRLQSDSREVCRTIRGVTDLILRRSVPSQGEPAFLSIGFDQQEEELLVDFVYQGEADWDRLQKELRTFLSGRNRGFELREEEFGEGRAVAALAFPFRT